MAETLPLLLLGFFLLLNSISCSRHLTALIKDPPLVLDYHNGELLSGAGPLSVYTLWCGDFPSDHKAAIADFFASFSDPIPSTPSVRSWWAITSAYKDSSGASISSSIKLAGELNLPTPPSKSLTSPDLESLLSSAISNSKLPHDPKALYLILTSKDISIEGFCVQSCASHRVLKSGPGSNLVYAWIGDSSSRCAGKCAWPFASAAQFGGPSDAPLVAPNGVGVDGMVINIATMIAGASSNPFGTGYFQGPASAPLEAVTACPGIFGQGAFAGYPGTLLADNKTGASFNVHGSNSRRFLLPALWNPSSLSCAYP